jgi:hypothetical protein
MKINKMNLRLFDGDVWKKLVVTGVKILFLTACLSPEECDAKGCFP